MRGADRGLGFHCGQIGIFTLHHAVGLFGGFNIGHIVHGRIQHGSENRSGRGHIALLALGRLDFLIEQEIMAVHDVRHFMGQKGGQLRFIVRREHGGGGDDEVPVGIRIDLGCRCVDNGYARDDAGRRLVAALQLFHDLLQV